MKLSPARMLVLGATLLAIALRLLFPVKSVDWEKVLSSSGSSRGFWLTTPVLDIRATLLQVGAITILGVAALAATWLPHVEPRRLDGKRLVIGAASVLAALLAAGVVAVGIRWTWLRISVTLSTPRANTWCFDQSTGELAPAPAMAFAYVDRVRYEPLEWRQYPDCQKMPGSAAQSSDAHPCESLTGANRDKALWEHACFPPWRVPK